MYNGASLLYPVNILFSREAVHHLVPDPSSHEAFSVSGIANTGGGGGGNEVQGGAGGAGGSGIVIVRYQGSASRATGGTITISGGYVYHTFTGSGTFVA